MNSITTVATKITPTRKRHKHFLSQRRLHNNVAAALLIAGVSITAGCGKPERELTTSERLKSVATAQDAPQEPAITPRAGVRDYMKELKDVRDNPKSEPAAIAAANKAIEAGKNDPSKLAAAAAGVIPAAPPATTASAPALTTSPTLTPPAPAPVTAPVAAAPATTPPPTVISTPPPAVAAARPVAPAAASAEVRAISREQPEFPREASQRNIDEGTVRARAAINANGEVTGVTILSANPARVFDRAVLNAYKNWKFNQGADGRTHEAEFGFKR